MRNRLAIKRRLRSHVCVPVSSPRHQAGQATIEYLYVLPVLLLILLASLQFIFIYEAKQTLNYAAFVGTRNGALNAGDMGMIEAGVASGLAPLFAHGDSTDGGADNLTGLKVAHALAVSELSNASLARIEILNPTPSALDAFGGTIPNDNLMYRPSDDIKGGVNVQDANLLKVRVTYCVRLVVPLVNRMIYAFTVAPPSTPDKADTLSINDRYSPAELLKNSVGTGASNALCVVPNDPYPYRIPVTAEAVVRMQTAFTDPGSSAVKDDTNNKWTTALP
ncbi:MAG TPA: TadE/TadG family type IV pilus assembly protein [Rhodocyclaceae bacterium]|nr:TadE/TadG family type IV pilus assembly protein [Rhodocyclaceae bacterium]